MLYLVTRIIETNEIYASRLVSSYLEGLRLSVLVIDLPGFCTWVEEI